VSDTETNTESAPEAFADGDRDFDFDAEDGTGREEPTRAELATRVEVLERENRRLREAYRAARRTRYRRAALALTAVGLVGFAGGAIFPSGRTVLWALGGTGVFAGVLTAYLTPERFVAATFSERVYETLAENEHEVVDALGLADERVYVPVADPTLVDPPVYLYIPQSAMAPLPSTDDLASVFVVGEGDTARGVAFRPTGTALFEAFERGLSGPVPADPGAVLSRLADALVEQFEFADAVDPALDTDGGRATVAVRGGTYGSVGRFDHPVTSLLAVGLAVGLDRPVTVDVDATDAETVVLTWGPRADHGGDPGPERDRERDRDDTATDRPG
jgi:hypothetical protein